jgi:hypothetical protein
MTKGVQQFPLYAKSPPDAIKAAVDLARSQFEDETLSPTIRVQSQVFLLYRMILGQTDTSDAYNIWNRFIELPQGDKMTARWFCSRLLVKTYMDIILGGKLSASILNLETENALKEQVLIWPPQVLNYLRAVCLSEYYRFLDNQTLNRSRLDEIWAFYAKVASSMRISEYAYRPTEMVDDCKVLQMLPFIYRAANALDFPDRGWCPHKKLLLGVAGKCPFALASRTLSTHNPEKALWTFQDPL